MVCHVPRFRLVLLTLGIGVGLTACSTSPPGPVAVTRVLSPTESACLSAVRQESGIGELSIASEAPTANGSVVRVAAPGSNSSWTCAVSLSGQVQSITPT